MDEKRFALVGIRPLPPPPAETRPKWRRGTPLVSLTLLGAILLGCLLCGWTLPRDPAYMDLAAWGLPPGREHWFGTDSMGRDLFAMIWHGGRLSLLIGLGAAALSGALALLAGCLAGLGPAWLDRLVMRGTELLLSVPELLWVLLLRGVLGGRGPGSLALVIGLTGWPVMARVIRTEARQLRGCGYVQAARCMGAGWFHVLKKHLLPNLFPSMMFMMVMNVRGAMMTESTLSFLGLGLPLEVISWGSLLSLSQRAMLGGDWWSVVFPGAFLAAVLLCLTGIGNWLRGNPGRRESNL